MPLLLLKAKIPTMISAHTRADGGAVKPHIAMRGVGESPEARGGSPLEAFIARHGGAERFQATLAEMSPEQRAKLVEAMGQMHEGGADGVMSRLGVAHEGAQAPSPDAASEPVDLSGIHDEMGQMGAADDREDLADAMVRDPHSEEATSLLKRIAKRLFGS